MRSLALTSLGFLGLALMAPRGAEAQYAPSSVPSGYQPPAASAPNAMAPVGLDGRPMPGAVVEAPHNHRGRTPCAACVAKMQAANPALSGKIVACEHWKGGDSPTICAKCQAKFASNSAMVPGKIVGCEHSRNGVCSACQALLNQPGQFVMSGGQPVTNAPGRAVASNGSNTVVYTAGMQSQAPLYDNGMGDPAPVGVVQANFSQGSPMAPPVAYAPQAMAPGHAVAEAVPGRDPYQAKSGPFPRPHILGHLFGWSGLGAEKAEAKAWKKAEAHAMITYDQNGTAPVDEIPASMVFGKKQR